MKFKINWDAFGIGTSVLCAIHCTVLPLIATTLPIFGINIIHNGFFEWAMIGLAFIVGSYALFHGFFTHHHSIKPLLLFVVGFALLVTKQFITEWHNWLLTPAVLLIIAAHYTNYRKCHVDKQQECNHHQH